jgi:RNA polymerase sigma factor (sigma-70 family)
VEKRQKFRGEASPYTWIQAIARNAAREPQSRERTIQFESTDWPDAREIAAPRLVADELEKRGDWLRLDKALDRLPAKDRRALIARFIDGLSIRTIAHRERVPAGTVLSRIHKGKQLLREAWELPLNAPHADAATRGTPLPKLEERRRSQASESSGCQRSDFPEPATWDR